MANLIEQFKDSDPKTKNFIYTCVIFSLIIIVGVVYCYARLDFVRSYQKNTTQIEGK